MSFKPHVIPPVPEETARVARAAFLWSAKTLC
jgi:hypothetical protein